MKRISKQFRISMFGISGLFVLAAAGCNQTNDTRTSAAGRDEVSTAPASAEVSDPQQAVRAYIRAVHTVRGAGPVALAVDGHNIVSDLKFGSASQFVGLHDPKVKIHAAADHKITVTDAAGKTIGGPLSLDLERGEDVTVVIGGTPGNITLTPFEHTNRGSKAGMAKLAVLHSDPALPEVSLQLDDKAQPNDIGYGQVTRYLEVAPGQHTLRAQYDKALAGVVDADRAGAPASPPRPAGVTGKSIVSLTQPLNLKAGEVYSVIVFADANGLPALRLLEDKFRPALIRAPDANATTTQNEEATAAANHNAAG